MARPAVAPEIRFFAKVKQESSSDCWIWTGFLLRGYGSFSVTSKKTLRAHRWAYEFLRAPIPDGLQLDHLCRNPSCVNPWHLEPVTARVNSRRGTSFAAVNAAKTTCQFGHPFEYRPNGWRRCRICLRRSQLAHYYRKRSPKRFEAFRGACSE